MPKDQNRMRSTFIPPTKPMKTERTHEENQERAYVAASRRSDRSLEARVESARRASEIHKRRTGRGFKITIEGVEKEEMYEEEDDLPSQYRNVSSHLYSTGGAAFNDRMSNFLLTNMAMRKMVAEQMQQFEAQGGQINPHQFTTNMASMQMPMQMPMPQAQYNPPPQQSHSAAMYRHAPYPTPRPPPTQQVFHHGHQRSASYASPAGHPAPVQHSPVVHATDHRRMSMPAAIPSAAGSPLQMNTPNSAPSVQSTPPQKPTAMSSRQSSSYGYQPPASQPQQQQMPAYDMNALPLNYFPFTAQLPANAQGLLGSTLDPTDPLTHMMMAGSGNMPTSYYDFGSLPEAPTNVNTGGQQTHPTLDGLGSTLAPSAFDTPASVDQSQAPSFFNDAFTAANSEHATPAATPGDNVQWGQFLNNDWDDFRSSQTSQI